MHTRFRRPPADGRAPLTPVPAAARAVMGRWRGTGPVCRGGSPAAGPGVRVGRLTSHDFRVADAVPCPSTGPARGAADIAGITVQLPSPTE